MDEGPIWKVKQRSNRVHHLERWGYGSVPRIEVPLNQYNFRWEISRLEQTRVGVMTNNKKAPAVSCRG